MFVVGMALSAAVTLMFAEGRLPGHAAPLDNLGIIESIQLPENARTLAEIHSFTIALSSVDDFSRVYVNNYLVLTGEWRDGDILFDHIDNKELQTAFAKLRSPRQNPLLAQADATRFLNVGPNFVVVELENSMLGGCQVQLSMTVNGHVIRGFPRLVPKDFEIESPPVNATLAKKFKEAAMSEPEISSSGDAICSRRVFQFDVAS
jgi:hypothetical protein